MEALELDISKTEGLLKIYFLPARILGVFKEICKNIFKFEGLLFWTG